MSILKFKNGIQYIHNNDFKSIIIKFMFPFDYKKENLAYIALLSSLLSGMTKNYPNEDLLILEKKKRYFLSCSIYNMSVGKNGCLCYEFTIPDDSCLKDNYFDKQFELMEEIIYNPKVKNNKFYDDEFEREIKNLNLRLDSIDKNMNRYQHIKLLNLVDDEGLLSMDLYNHRDLIDKVNTSNLYDFYKNTISNAPFIFVFGNTDENIFNKLFDKYLIKNNEKEIIVDESFNNYLTNYKDKYDYYEECMGFKDSSLSVVYKIRDYSIDDDKYLYIVNGLMNSLSTRLLNKKLRDENDLVYNSRAGIYRHYGLFEVTALIHKDAKDIVFEKILEVMNDLLNEDYIEDLIKKVVDGERINQLRKLDSKYRLFDDYIFNYLGLDIDDQELYKMFLEIKPIDIVNFVKRFVIDTVYFLKEGDNND